MRAGSVKRNENGYERREFPRFEVPGGQVSAELSVGGSGPTRTIVRDISLGGVQLDLPEPLLDGIGAGICVVRFIDQRNDVLPAAARGRITRLDEDAGRHRVAIEFAQPLESVGAFSLST